jgi:ketosteroid isomerase-like protein
MSKENVQLVVQIFDTFSRKTWEAGEWIERYHPQLDYHPREDEPDTRPFVGRETWAQIVGSFMDAFAEITFDIEDTYDAGDWAIVATVMHASGGSSNVEVEDRYVFAYRIDQGLVVEGWEHHTIDEAVAALRDRATATESFRPEPRNRASTSALIEDHKPSGSDRPAQRAS